MIVPSLRFLLFVLAAALVFNLSTANWWRMAVLLIVNVVFLASFSHGLGSLVPYAGFIGLGFLAQYVTRNGAAPKLFLALLAMTLAAFFWLKRYTFVPSIAYIPFPYVLIGLSYVFFRVLHLIIDSHQGSIERPIGPISYLNYTLNFTSLTSGPIQRYQDYHRSEPQCLPLNLPVLGAALERIVRGYFKVAVVSMLLSSAHHQSIDGLANSQMLWDRVWSGMLIAAIYPVYLFFNFSGYVDVVIGAARLFRIELPENFDRPFSSLNFIEFWSRWHITLSNWLKTYVYNPLMLAALSRITAPRLAPYVSVGAFFVTFFLVGLWHGQTSEFLFFGFLQGGGVALNKLYQLVMQDRLGRKGYRALAANKFYQACSRGLTFTWFSFTLFWFWSDWDQIAGFHRAFIGAPLGLAWAAIFAGATIILAAMDSTRGLLQANWSRSPPVSPRYLRTVWVTVLSAVTVATIVLLDSTAPDIVYKTF
jgi:alginate O-acetyltransferase complex protein AlgI